RSDAALPYRRRALPVAPFSVGRDREVAPTEAMRVVFSESDQLPGLILDQYGDRLVIQALTLGIDKRKALIVDIVRELLQPKAIIERSDVPVRKLEGLPETKGVLVGRVTSRGEWPGHAEG